MLVCFIRAIGICPSVIGGARRYLRGPAFLSANTLIPDLPSLKPERYSRPNIEYLFYLRRRPIREARTLHYSVVGTGDLSLSLLHELVRLTYGMTLVITPNWSGKHILDVDEVLETEITMIDNQFPSPPDCGYHWYSDISSTQHTHPVYGHRLCQSTIFGHHHHGCVLNIDQRRSQRPGDVRYYNQGCHLRTNKSSGFESLGQRRAGISKQHA